MAARVAADARTTPQEQRDQPGEQGKSKKSGKEAKHCQKHPNQTARAETYLQNLLFVPFRHFPADTRHGAHTDRTNAKRIIPHPAVKARRKLQTAALRGHGRGLRAAPQKHEPAHIPETVTGSCPHCLRSPLQKVLQRNTIRHSCRPCF